MADDAKKWIEERIMQLASVHPANKDAYKKKNFGQMGLVNCINLSYNYLGDR